MASWRSRSFREIFAFSSKRELRCLSNDKTFRKPEAATRNDDDEEHTTHNNHVGLVDSRDPATDCSSLVIDNKQLPVD
jgi:hypothetical protein